MIGHYLGSAIVNAAKAPFTTAAKVVTLAMGLLVIILATGVVAYWRSTDSQVTPAGNRAIVITHAFKARGLNPGPIRETPYFLEKYLRADIPELKTMARFKAIGEVVVSSGERTVVLDGANAEPALLDIFHFNFLAGDPRTALRQGDGIVLTQSAAQRLFGSEPPLGRKLVLAGQRDVVVTGVIGPVPQPSQFSFDYLSAMPPDGPRPEYWGFVTDALYALRPTDGSLGQRDLIHRLAQVVEHRKPRDDTTVTLGAVPVSRTTEMEMNQTIFGSNSGGHSVPALLFGLAGIVLAVACLNYANLATAQTAGRAKEIGLRRVLGAGPVEILLQNWIDAGVATGLAAILTLGGLWLAAPIIATQTGVDAVGALFRDPNALAVVAGIVAGVILIAGLYPALLVLWIRPVDALRAGKIGGDHRGVGQVLIGLQFVSASALLIGLIVVGQQNAHVRQSALQHATDQVLFLPPSAQSGIPLDVLRRRLASDPRIKAVSEADTLPWSRGGSNTELARTAEGARSAAASMKLNVGFGYFDVFDQKVLAGRAFDPARDQGPAPPAPPSPDGVGPEPVVIPSLQPLVIDRAVTAQLGFPSPQAAVGQRLYQGGAHGQVRLAFVIIGVVEGRPHAVQGRSPGTVFALQPNDPSAGVLVRLAANDLDGGLAAVKSVWGQLAPDRTFTYQFEDQAFEHSFQIFDRVGRLFVALSLVALLISSVGLFGMAVHVTQRRLHEIGVRKTLGSSVAEVVGLLLADFSKPVVIANLLAWPLAYWGAKAYLAGFAQRIDLTVWPFVLSLAVTVAVAWLAVGGQTFKAARVRPAQVLRDA